MYINADEQGNIQLLSKIELDGCELYTGTIPDDFFDMVRYGKYMLSSGQIVEVPNWIMPEIPDRNRGN